MKKPTKRRGRPIKAPAKGERVSVTVMIDPALKRSITESIKASGRSQSQEIEARLERLELYERLHANMRMTLEQLEQASTNQVMRRKGYTVVHTSYGVAYFPPGWPAPKSGFIASEGDQS
jgi:hypothetical protein